MSRSCHFGRRRVVAALAVLVVSGVTPIVASGAPAGAAGFPLYSSHALAGTYGTPPETTKDPDHPARQLCYKAPCSAGKATYAEEVRTMAVSGNRLFLGGFFHGLVDGSRQPVSPNTPFLAELDATTGRLAADQTFARNAAPDGTVESIVVAPDRNRVYVGGRFSHIGGGAANRVAALNLQTGKLDPTFHGPAFDDAVRSIALSGDRLFVGGQFLKAGTAKAPGVTALNAADGSLVPGWTPPLNYGGSYIHVAATHTESTQGVVYAIAVADGGNLLMVGGDFQHLGWTASQDKNGLRYGGLVALNTSDGKLASWHPFNSRPVLGMAVSPDGQRLYTAEGGSGGYVGAFDPGGTENQLWFGRVDGDAMSVAATDQRVYVGGHFDAEVPNHNDNCLKSIPTHCTKTGSHHRHLVAFNLQGKADPGWTAQADTPEGPTFLLAGRSALYLGGNFTNTLDKSKLDGGTGIPHPGFAMFPG